MAKYVGFKTGKVHESHVISEYYCGGCGYPVTDHDSFCPECGGAFRKHDADDLESENAKLRKLVQGLWFALLYSGMNQDGATGRGFARQMRELGIEVPHD